MLSCMDNLPTEVLLVLASKLEKRDIPNFRLVSRKFAKVGFDYLWIRGYFYLREYSFRRLKNAANDPFWRNLREIIFYIDLVPDFESQDAWIKQASAVCERTELDQPRWEWMQQNRGKIVSMRMAKKSFQDAGWEIHKQIRKEQEHLAFMDLECLKRFQHLKSLRMEVCYQDTEAQRSLCRFEGDWCFWNTVYDVESYPKVSSRLLDIVLRNTRLTSLRAFNGMPNLSDAQKLDASSNLFMHLKSLQLTTIGPEDGYTEVPSFRQDLPDLYDREAEDKNVEIVLNGLLVRTNLVTLSLITHIWPPLRAEMVFENCVWSRTTRMSLYYLMIHPPTFLPFLKSLPLKELHLASPTLPETGVRHGWPIFLKLLGEELNLTDFGLESAWEDGGRFEFNDWKKITLSPGVVTTAGAVARYLICGKYPHECYVPLVHRVDFEGLGWDHVLAAVTEGQLVAGTD